MSLHYKPYRVFVIFTFTGYSCIDESSSSVLRQEIEVWRMIHNSRNCYG